MPEAKDKNVSSKENKKENSEKIDSSTKKATGKKATSKKTTGKKTTDKKSTNSKSTNSSTKKTTTTSKNKKGNNKKNVKSNEKTKVENKKNDVVPSKEEKKEESAKAKKQVSTKNEKPQESESNLGKNNKKEKKNIKGPKKENYEPIEKEEIIEEVKEDKEIVTEKSELPDTNKDLIASPKKEILETGEKPEYVQEMIKKRKRKKIIFALLILVVLLIILFSTIFAILNMNNSNIIKGVSIKNIDVSELSKEDALNKLTEATDKELIAEVILKYGEEYSVSLKPEQIEFKYNINQAVDEAHLVGRSGNVLLDNYSIIFSKLLGKETKINYEYNGDLLNQFIDDINSKIPGIVVEPTYYIEDDKLFVNKGTDGIKVKSEELKNEIIQAILQRNAGQMTDGFEQIIEIPTEDVKASEIDMEKIYAEIYKEPQDAYYETDPYKIYPDVSGVDLIVSVEEAQNEVNREDKQEYVFDLKITEAEKTLDDLGTEAFPYLISQFSTKYDASNKNRSTNLELAAEKINGKVLMPGEEFSFNKIVGKRTVEEGYKDAKIYADGGVVDGLAGGICQISSTLYNSVLLANLQIVERRNHSFTTSYLPAGKDATVVWGTTDFRFINSRSYPIKIEATVSNGVAEFKLYGMQEETEYEVRILPVKTQSIPYTTTYEEDPTLMPGQQVVKQAGHAGCKVTTYKELRLNGAVVSKEAISNDTYQPMRTIIKVAPGCVPAQ